MNLKPFHKKRFFICFLFLFVTVFTLTSSQAPSKLISSVSLTKEQRSFDRYTNDLFVQELSSNTINLHYTLADPDSFDIKDPAISLGSLSKDAQHASIAQLENMSAVLSEFDPTLLSAKQQLTYDILTSYCNRELSATSFYYYHEPLRPTTGTQSELPILLAEYAFYKPSDVTDYLALLACMDDYFKEISVFEVEKSKAGLFMPDFAAETVINACQIFTADPDKNYLIDTFDTRIDAMTDLSNEKKTEYKDLNRSLIQNHVIPAYNILTDTLSKLKDSGSKSGSLSGYENGKAYYEYLVGVNTGSDKTIPELQKRTEKQRADDLLAIHNLLVKNPKLLSTDDPKLSFSTPEEMLDHLLEAIQTDFYPAPETHYEVNYIHKSLEDTLAPAFYLTAPIDRTDHNVIYLNGKSNYQGLSLFTTLAHEGYPGHLYQTTGSYHAGFTPLRAILNYPGYVEGWATYVEMLSYQYAGLDHDTADMLMHNQSALLSLYATIDMGIHYDGWNLSDTASFLNGYGIKDSDTIRRIYELIIEEPSHYLKYYIGYLEFLELQAFARNEFKDEFSMRAFHQAVIRMGPAPFPLLKKYLHDFYTI